MKEQIPVSVVVMTKNEEKNIAQCLDSVSAFPEVFVVDSGSVDQTVPIAEEKGAQVVQFKWDGKYPKKKQWCLENLPFSFQWVLYVDADEVVTPSLTREISRTLKENLNNKGFFIGYDYVFLGKVLKYGHKIYKLILFDKNAGKFLDYDDLDVENMWEVEGHYQPQIEGSVGKLKSKMIHHDHEDLYSFFKKLNRYSDWEAHLRMRGALRSDAQSSLKIRSILQYIGDHIPFRWLGMFFYSYFFRLGFLDGVEGFYYALALGIYHAMIDMKIMERELNPKK